MWCLSKPERKKIRQFLSAQAGKQFSYAHVEASRERAPDGYNVDHNRIQLGEGADIFERAKSAIRQWKMFDMPWIELCWPDTPIKTGATVAVLVSHLGFWSLNACRIVYEIDERGDSEKFGFAYGTCRNMESGARNGLAWNSIELTKACGTTFMHFPGLVPRHVWPILLRRLCKNALLKSPKRPCKGPCNATEIRVGRDWHRKTPLWIHAT